MAMVPSGRESRPGWHWKVTMNRIVSNEIGLAAFARFGKALTSTAKRIYARTQLENVEL